MDGYGLKLSTRIRSKLERSLIMATISNGWSFNWVERAESVATYQVLHPGVDLPSRKALAGPFEESSA